MIRAIRCAKLWMNLRLFDEEGVMHGHAKGEWNSISTKSVWMHFFDEFRGCRWSSSSHDGGNKNHNLFITNDNKARPSYLMLLNDLPCIVPSGLVTDTRRVRLVRAQQSNNWDKTFSRWMATTKVVFICLRKHLWLMCSEMACHNRTRTNAERQRQCN